jgi:hypothetical protein
LIDNPASAHSAGLCDLGIALARQTGGLKGEPAIDQGLDAVLVREAEKDRGAEIRDGVRRLAELAIGNAAKIKRPRRLRGHRVLGIDGRGELPHGVIVLASRERGRPILKSRILGESWKNRADKQERRAQYKMARPESLPMIRHVLAQAKKSGKSEASVYSTVTDLARFRG